jgi:RNA polymerase sigma-70 factor (ECF subfamily)
MQEINGSLEAFLAAVERRAFRMARIAVGDTEEALDIVQDAMFELVRHYAVRPATEWRPLFYRILVNRIRDGYRRKAVRRRWLGFMRPLRTMSDGKDAKADPIESAPDLDAIDPDRKTVLRDSMAALDAALERLPQRQQQAFLLRAWEGLSVGETAAAMNCSAGSVKTHYSRAVGALRKALEGHWP